MTGESCPGVGSFDFARATPPFPSATSIPARQQPVLRPPAPPATTPQKTPARVTQSDMSQSSKRSCPTLRAAQSPVVRAASTPWSVQETGGYRSVGQPEETVHSELEIEN